MRGEKGLVLRNQSLTAETRTKRRCETADGVQNKHKPSAGSTVGGAGRGMGWGGEKGSGIKQN